MSLVLHGIIVTDLKKSFVAAKLRHLKYKSNKIAKFSILTKSSNNKVYQGVIGQRSDLRSSS